MTSPVARGATATLQAKSAPNVTCAINVTYDSGPSKAAGLEPHATDSGGAISWSWKVGTTTKPGNYPIQVSCDQSGSDSTTFAVQ